MKLSIIIVNYNVRYFLEQTLLSTFKAIDGIDAEVFVVDNNSKDDSVEMVKNRFPEVRLIANKDNPGFSIANNQAIRQSRGEYILLLNPDTVVAEDTFSICTEFMDQHIECGGLGVKMLDGSGKFLPESKRGFPTPFVAFCKAFGLSGIFPTSKTFNQYHLGFLSKDDTHKIDVLAGAYMMLRKSVLDEVGLLDEKFFMYGEDIDLSYRIKKAGYENYYLSDTSIIHYKGESTKKGSLNYVKVFYNAMIIFSKKHFSGSGGRLLVLMLQFAIYFRALLTLVSNFFKKFAMPFTDAAIIIIGLFFLQDFWANYYFKNPDYYGSSFLKFNIPLYTFIWITSIFFNGGYDEKQSLRRPSRGLLMGTIFLAAIYGFLDVEYRSSRMLIILGALWSFLAILGSRYIYHFIKYRNLNLGGEKKDNLAIVGSKEETDRTLKLLQEAQVNKNIIGNIGTSNIKHPLFLGNTSNTEKLVQLFKIDELIFCSKDINYKSIIQLIEKLGPNRQFKILPNQSNSIIGSHSKNHSGELYTIEIDYDINSPIARRNKRIIDIIASLIFILFSPFLLFICKNPSGLFKNILSVLLNKKTWVGYHDNKNTKKLPLLNDAVIHVSDIYPYDKNNDETLQKLDFFYAKDYTAANDISIISKGLRHLGK